MASEPERVSLACLRTRSSRPRSCPWALSAEAEQQILRARSRTRYGPARLAGLVGFCRGTIYKVLARHGVSRRRAKSRRQTFRRYEWSQPGALLHLDTMKLPKFDRPGHWAHGDRRQRTRGAGSSYVVSVIDDHSRLAYSELHGSETAVTVTATLRRAATWMAEQGCGPLEAVMTDNHKAHTSDAFQALLGELGARHILTPPYTPRWNGKVERFHQTMEREWAKGLRYRNSSARNQALPHWLRHYNQRRPHSSLGGRPPISRVHNVPRQDS